MTTTGFIKSLLAAIAALQLSLGAMVFAVESPPAKGVGVLLDDIECRRALELVKSTDMVLYLQFGDAKDAMAALKVAEESGLLNTRIYVATSQPGRIALADNQADYIVGKGDIPDAEVLRSLNPRGCAQVNGKELRKPWPTGIESWSHPRHGPDNNLYSNDKRTGGPYLTQFVAKPMWGPWPYQSVAAGGRLYRLSGHAGVRGPSAPMVNTLAAYNAFNGAFLWVRNIPDGFNAGRHTLVASTEALYFGDDTSCKVLHPDTGAILHEIIPPPDQAEGTVWKWMAMQDGVLYALLGGQEIKSVVARYGRTGLNGKLKPDEAYQNYLSADPKTLWTCGRNFFAIDLKTTRILWHHRSDDIVEGISVAMRNDRIYFRGMEKLIGCLNAQTGQLVWKNVDPQVLRMLPFPSPTATKLQFSTKPSLTINAGDKTLCLGSQFIKGLVVLSAETGELLWHRNTDGQRIAHPKDPDSHYRTLFINDRLWISSMSTPEWVEPLTGKSLSKAPGARTCSEPSGTCGSIFSWTGTGTRRSDIGSEDGGAYLPDMRPPCIGGVTISEGHLYWGPMDCVCPAQLFGTIALQGDANRSWDKGPAAVQELKTSRPAQGSVKVNPGDWMTYGADNTRSFSSSIRVPARPAALWTFLRSHSGPASLPKTPFAIKAKNLPTAVTAGDGIVSFGGSDGVVYAIDAATGAVRWKTCLGGETFFPPTLWHGLAIVGANDGKVYALDTATGEPIWITRIAPADRRIMVYERLQSNWPAACGVAIEDGLLYAVAGMANHDGIYVCALDAATGEGKWMRDIAAPNKTPSKSISPDSVSVSGPIMIKNGKIELTGSARARRIAVNKSTGVLEETEKAEGRRRGILFPREMWEPWQGDFENKEIVSSTRGKLIAGTSGVHWGKPDMTVKTSPQGSVVAEGIWSTKAFNPTLAVVVAENAVLVAGQCAPPSGGKRNSTTTDARFAIAAFNIVDGAELWRIELPCAPIHNGIAMDGAGRVCVSLESGEIRCLGEGR